MKLNTTILHCTGKCIGTCVLVSTLRFLTVLCPVWIKVLVFRATNCMQYFIAFYVVLVFISFLQEISPRCWPWSRISRSGPLSSSASSSSWPSRSPTTSGMDSGDVSSASWLPSFNLVSSFQALGMGHGLRFQDCWSVQVRVVCLRHHPPYSYWNRCFVTNLTPRKNYKLLVKLLK